MHTLNTASYQKYLLYMMAVPLTVPIIALVSVLPPCPLILVLILHTALA